MVTKNKVKGKDIPPSYYEKLAMAESSGNPNAKAQDNCPPGEICTASGLYQFTESTWKDMVKQEGLDYTLEDRFDPDKSLEVVKRFTQRNKNYLERNLGRDVTENELYLAHFLGMGGSRKMLKAYQEFPELTADRVLGEGSVNSNPNVFLNKDGSVKTLRELYKWSADKFGVKGVEVPKDDAIWSVDERGNYINLNPDFATEAERQASNYMKQQYINTLYPEIEVTDNTNTATNTEQALQPTKESVEAEEKPQWKQELDKKQEERDTVFDFIAKGALNTQTVDYNRQPLPNSKKQQFQDGGTKEDPPTEVYYGTPEYEKAYKEGRIQGQELDEVVITADKRTGKNILEDYPFYNELSEQEKEYFRDSSLIGRQIRARARDGKGVTADKASAMGSQLLEGALSVTQVPQSTMVEGVEALRGNEYDFNSVLPGNKQRVPSEVWGYENPEGFLQNAANIGMDVVLDPSNIVGGGAVESGLKQGVKKGLISSAKQRSINAIEKAKKATSSVDDIGKKLDSHFNDSFLSSDQDKESLLELKNIFKKHKENILSKSKKEKDYSKTVEDANNWSKEWFNDPERVKLIDATEKSYQKALDKIIKRRIKNGKDIKFLKNPFSSLKNNIKDNKFNSRIANPNSDKSKNVLGVSGYRYNANKKIVERQNKVFLETIKEHVNTNFKQLSKKERQNKIDELVEHVTIHEGNHGLTDGNTLLPKVWQKDMVKIFGKDASIPSRNPNTNKFDTMEEYIQNPTEIYARIMEMRKFFGIKPKDKITPKQAFEMRKKIASGETPIHKEFGQLIQDPKKLTEIMNYLPAIVPAVGVGAAMQNTTDKTQQFQDGGTFPISKNGLYDYPNQPVVVPTKDGNITMKGINHPVLGIANTGEEILMQPGKEYNFKEATEVLEIPQFQDGGKYQKGGHNFKGYNKPIKTPNHPKKSHAVLAKEGDTIKLIRFGQQGVKGAGKNPSSEKDKNRKNLLKQDTLKIYPKER